MCKPDNNQNPPQQCGLHHLGYVYVRKHPRILLQHPRVDFEYMKLLLIMFPQKIVQQ